MGQRARGGMGAVLGGVDQLFHPEAARARETIERDHSLVVPMPSPGDRMLDEGRLIVDRAALSANRLDGGGAVRLR
jgi:hypothetical protein